MKSKHLLEALRVTAREYAALPNGQLIAQALRGVVARAERYEAQEPPAEAQWHRLDGWERSDLPDGFRPLRLDEMDGKEHDDIEWKPTQHSSWNTGSWHAEGPGWFRTKRPNDY